MYQYFSAGNTSQGFVNYFDDSIDKDNASQILYIKGGSGVGKSTLMRKASNIALSKGYDVTQICCSSDYRSLDGVVINGDMAIFDATMPHIADPTYPMLNSKIVDLSTFLDSDKLKPHKDSIISLYKEKKKHYIALYSYLSTLLHVEEIMLDLFDIDTPCMDEMQRELYELMLNNGTKTIRGFAHSIDSEKIVSLEEHMIANKKIVNILSSYDIMSKYLIDKVSHMLDNSHVGHRKFYDITLPTMVEIVASMDYHLTYNDSITADITYNIDDAIKLKNKRAYDILINYQDDILSLCMSEIALSKSAHEKIEHIYQSAMDFDSLNEYTTALLDRLFCGQ